ncbi:MAG: hypothetical protein M1339_04360, partial [Bacteroidetes bacterium]|nr:hypothetical protein [Bacteroidota bacterium]
LVRQFARTVNGLDDAFEAVMSGHSPNHIEDMSVGSAKRARAAVLNFDICDYGAAASSPDPVAMKKLFITIDSLAPLVMQIIFDHGGYVEKNSGANIVGVLSGGSSDYHAANTALDASTTILFAVRKIVNPFLHQVSIPQVSTRIGIDLGPVLISRTGIRSASGGRSRKFLNIIGPAAHLATLLQQQALPNGILVGDLVKKNAKIYRQSYFMNATPPEWSWHYKDEPEDKYELWSYNAEKPVPV